MVKEMSGLGLPRSWCTQCGNNTACARHMIADAVSPEALCTANVPDMVNHPPHYKVGAFECIDAIEALGLDYHLGCVLKYIWRAGRKGDVLEDLKKARWYLDRAIERRLRK